MQTMKQAAAEFLAGKRVAVTGVSRKPQGHGSNVVYQRLRQRGYEVFAVNPDADDVAGDTCYHDLKSVPTHLDWVVIGNKPETADATMRECADLGIKRVWMHRGPGAGKRVALSRRVRPPARHHRDRGRMPVHVRPHRGPRPHGDAVRVHPDGRRATTRVKVKKPRHLPPKWLRTPHHHLESLAREWLDLACGVGTPGIARHAGGPCTTAGGACAHAT
jgi:predicted CoA-binding protein